MFKWKLRPIRRNRCHGYQRLRPPLPCIPNNHTLFLPSYIQHPLIFLPIFLSHVPTFFFVFILADITQLEQPFDIHLLKPTLGYSLSTMTTTSVWKSMKLALTHFHIRVKCFYILKWTVIWYRWYSKTIAKQFKVWFIYWQVL